MVVAVMVIVCGRHGCGRDGHCLWPSLLNPSQFMSVRQDVSKVTRWMCFTVAEVRLLMCDDAMYRCM